MGSSQYSGVLSNLGIIRFPSSMLTHIESLMVISPPPNKMIKVSCGMIGFNEHISITFGNISRSRELEKNFFRFLTGEKIPIAITYNRNCHDECV
jgi:hypothetical protein